MMDMEQNSGPTATEGTYSQETCVFFDASANQGGGGEKKLGADL